MKFRIVVMSLLMSMTVSYVYAASLEISCGDCQNAAVGSEVTCTVSVVSAPNEVISFGFDFLYDSDVLAYKSYSKGAVAEGRFTYFEANEDVPGHLICGGFETGSNPLPAGSSGEFLKLVFDVKANGACGAELSNLADGFECWSANPPIVPKVPAGQSFSTTQNSQNGDPIGMIQDVEDNSEELTFSIFAGNDDQAFAINNSGVITINDSTVLDCINIPSYSLDIRIAGCTAYTDTNVTVHVVKPTRGNVNNDCKTDLQDAVLALKTLTGIQTDTLTLNADVNSDSKIGIQEAVFVLRSVSNP